MFTICNRNEKPVCGIDRVECGLKVASGGTIFSFRLVIGRLFGAGFFLRVR